MRETEASVKKKKGYLHSLTYPLARWAAFMVGISLKKLQAECVLLHAKQTGKKAYSEHEIYK